MILGTQSVRSLGNRCARSADEEAHGRQEDSGRTFAVESGAPNPHT